MWVTGVQTCALPISFTRTRSIDGDGDGVDATAAEDLENGMEIRMVSGFLGVAIELEVMRLCRKKRIQQFSPQLVGLISRQ